MLLTEKWAEVLNEGENPIPKQHQDAVAMMLENQAKELNEGETTNVTGGVDKWDPILVGMVRRTAPKLLAFDVAGVQPMTGPSGLIFTLRSRYTNQAGQEAFLNAPDSGFSGKGTRAGSIFGGDDLYNNTTGNAGADGTADGTALSTGTGLTAAESEALGVSGSVTDFNEMALTVEKHAITAKTRALKAEYSVELEQDMQAIHGVSAEKELVNVLSTEITQEINRELLDTMYSLAKLGAQNCNTPGLFDVTIDSNGRWAAERFKSILFQIELERNAIARESRRGKGNFVVASSNVCSALAMAGVLDNRGDKFDANLVVDSTGSTFVGMMNGVRVYLDPYVDEDFVLVGYNGASAWDSALIYSPYVPLTLYKTTHEKSFQPALAFRTRYALSKAPLETGSATIDLATDRRTHPMLRIFKVDNLF